MYACLLYSFFFGTQNQYEIQPKSQGSVSGKKKLPKNCEHFYMECQT